MRHFASSRKGCDGLAPTTPWPRGVKKRGTFFMTTPNDILRDGLKQMRLHGAPQDAIDALTLAIFERALVEIAALGGHQGILAQTALTDAKPTP